MLSNNWQYIGQYIGKLADKVSDRVRQMLAGSSLFRLQAEILIIYGQEPRVARAAHFFKISYFMTPETAKIRSPAGASRQALVLSSLTIGIYIGH